MSLAARQAQPERVFEVCGETLLPASDGTLYWPGADTLIVADLHLEKGSSYAARGVYLPPYDSTATLAALAAALGRLRPGRVIALGDSFHDPGGGGRLPDGDRAMLAGLVSAHDWVWIAGNHDPAPPEGIGGRFAEDLAVGPLVFRHEPTDGACEGEVAGHLHPVARLMRRGRSIRRRCFATDGTRLVLPAFGAYAGGLNVLDGAFAPLFTGRRFTTWMLGSDDVYPVLAARLRKDG